MFSFGKKRSLSVLIIVLGVFLLSGIFSLVVPGTVNAANPVTIKVDGEIIHTFSVEELQAMESDEGAWVEARLYSTINTWPTKNWYVSEGVRLKALFEKAKILGDSNVALDDIKVVRVTSVDGFLAAFTKKQLFDDTRYYFPGLKENHQFFGQIPGEVDDDELKPEPVEAIIALRSVEASDNPDYMGPLNCPLFVLGQRWITEQTNHTFVKYTGEVDFLTSAPLKWVSPEATVTPSSTSEGKVPMGAEVRLTNEFNDADKIYYTTDGTDPTLESPIYNWIASRWWGSRAADLDEVNKPIIITEDTVLKAITIGNGREDSDIAIFEYEVETVAATGVSISDGEQTLYAGDTVQLNAIVEPETATNKSVTWSSSDLAVAVVSDDGLVTAEGEGTATITVTTDDGGFTDSVTINVDPAGNEPPQLHADTSNNKVGNSIEVTFEDDEAWREAITGVSVDGTVLQEDRYTIGEGKLTFSAGVFTSIKDYSIVVKAKGYQDAILTQPIKTGSGSGSGSEPGTKTPPTLTFDTKTYNEDPRDVRIIFEEDATWQEAVTDVTANGKSIAGRYECDEAGRISIDYNIFKDVGEYTFTIKANGYQDATLKLNIEPYLTITGAVATPKEYTVVQLEALPQHQELYSCINTWPTKRWYVGKGVALSYLLGREQSDISSSATLVKIVSSDGYYMTLTVEELLNAPRYRFPNFKEGSGDADGHLPGSSAGKVKVEAILGLVSVEASDNPDYMNSLNALLLMLGQRAVTEQTGPLFVKNVNKIEVLTDSIPQWDEPTAKPESGTVFIGEGEVELSNLGMDQDKVHYTLDGSTPTLESPIYNWIARRWWSSRGEDTVAEVNHPITITKDTTIKAITIGPAKRDSSVATFTYKVTSSSTERVAPGKDSKISFGEKVFIEIPADALAGSGAVDVKIEHVEEPPSLPAGYRLLSSVYEFSVDNKKNFNFAKKVKLSFSFDPKKLNKGETPSVYYYDEKNQGCWVGIGGTVKDDTISVEVDHFTKFAVMAAGTPSVSEKITPGKGGTLSLGNDVTLEIPAGALAGNKELEVKIERVKEPSAVPAGYRLLGDVFEFSVDGKKNYVFAKKVKIKFSFNAEGLGKAETPTVYYYDEAQSRWVNIGGEVSGNSISVEVDHFTKYAVMTSLPTVVKATIVPAEGGELYLGEEAGIEIPAGALAGSKAVEIKIERVEKPPVVPAGYKLLSDVFEFSIGGRKSYQFAKKVKIKLGFDPKISGKGEVPAIHYYYYDELKSRWVDVGGNISGNTITVEVDHLTQFAVLAPVKQVKPQLTDIAGHWAYDNIKKLVDLGVISGYPDGSFKPDNNITRAEFATVLVKALQVENESGRIFADTAAHWAKEYIATAASNGIISGYDPHTFGPDDLLNREQMAVMIANATKLSPSSEKHQFADSGRVSTWAEASLSAAVKNNIINGYPDNTFRPQGPAARAEAVTVVVKALEKVAK
jgi:hypothetical protein